ncbi:MAG: PAS domain-containing protein, partial [Sphingobium sp.]
MLLSRASLNDTPPRETNLLSLLGLADTGDIDAAWMSRGLIQVGSLWPLILLAKLCVAALLGIPFYMPVDLAHTAAFAAMLLVDGLIILMPRREAFARRLPHVQKWAMLPLVFLSGLFFRLWLSGADWEGADGFILAAPELAVAMLAVCVFGDRRLLGLSYFLGALLISVIQQAGFVAIGLLVSCVAVMFITTLRQARADRARALDQHARDERALRADRLLHEYEESGRGWFWETDRHGCLTYLSETLARKLDQSATSLIGRPITDIVQPGDRQAGDGER